MPCHPYKSLIDDDNEPALQAYLEPVEVALLANLRPHNQEQARPANALWRMLPENQPESTEGVSLNDVDM